MLQSPIEFTGRSGLSDTALSLLRHNGSAFSGVRRPGIAATNASDSAILPRRMSAQPKQVGCYDLLIVPTQRT